jgi:hypothetical protein
LILFKNLQWIKSIIELIWQLKFCVTKNKYIMYKAQDYD